MISYPLKLVSHARTDNPFVSRSELETAEPVFAAGLHAEEGGVNGGIEQLVGIIVFVLFITLIFSGNMHVHASGQSRIERYMGAVEVGEPDVGHDA